MMTPILYSLRLQEYQNPWIKKTTVRIIGSKLCSTLAVLASPRAGSDLSEEPEWAIAVEPFDEQMVLITI